MKSNLVSHPLSFILSTLVVPVFAWGLIQMGGGGALRLKNLRFSTVDNSFTAHAVTNNRHTMKLEDAPVGTSIQIGSKTFIKIATNQYMQKAPICHTRVWDFDYTGTEQTFSAPVAGTYKLEVWGAQGGYGLADGSFSPASGYGGYAVGVASYKANTVLHVVVGGRGANGAIKVDVSNGGYNGGGDGYWDQSDNESTGGGGGATHIATKAGLLSTLADNKNSIQIVAGGGGGDAGWSYGHGHGGGYIGVVGERTSTDTIPGSQTSGYAFGQGGPGSRSACTPGSGGGGGWYGGSGGINTTGSGSCGYDAVPGAGGSGYIGSSNLISGNHVTKHMTCYNCTTSNDNATRTQSNTCVNANPTVDCSKTGHGHARITLLTASDEDCYIPECSSGTAYSAKYGDCKPLASFTQVVQVSDFAYTGSAQTFTVPTNGLYKVELWGAQGGKSIRDGKTYYDHGGNGGYTSGNIALDHDTDLQIYIGSKGAAPIVAADAMGGYNGGGYSSWDHSDDEITGGGGGASDIRIVKGKWDDQNSLRSRIMVAAGGGGSHLEYSFDSGTAHAGGLTGYTINQNIQAGTQISGYQFGKGQDAPFVVSNQECNGGGGGWYGGQASIVNGNIGYGGGGSSYISGHTGCVAVTSLNDTTPKAGCTTGTSNNSCSLSPTGKSFTNTVMIDGAGYSWTNTKGGLRAMPNPAGGTYESGVGHTGDGYARITRLEVPAGDCGLHATLTGTNTCTCTSGYYANSAGATTTNVGGECLYRKCGNNTTAEYAISCTCLAGYYIEGQGTFSDPNLDYDCVACAANTVYNSTSKSCIATTM